MQTPICMSELLHVLHMQRGAHTSVRVFAPSASQPSQSWRWRHASSALACTRRRRHATRAPGTRHHIRAPTGARKQSPRPIKSLNKKDRTSGVGIKVDTETSKQEIPGGLGGPTKTRSPAPRSARANMRLAAGKRASVHGISACACNVLKYACTCTDTACIVYAIKRAPERMSGRASGFATHPTNGAACMRVCMHAAMAPCHPSGSPAEAPYPNAYRRTEQIEQQSRLGADHVLARG